MESQHKDLKKSELISNKLSKKWKNYSSVFNKLFRKGVSVNIFKFDRAFKIALNPVSIKKLNREVQNSKQALQWDIYSNKVIPLKKISPFAAVSDFIEDERKNDHAHKLGKLVDFYEQNFDYALRASKVPAYKIINSQLNKLGIDLTKDHPVYSQLRRLKKSDYFTFQLPMTPMHGDISAINLIIEEEKLRLIDFEFAMDTGSILYDWWSLKKRMDKSNDKAKSLNVLIEKALERLELSANQFNAFGYAMFSVSSISGFETNKFDDLVKTNKYINRIHAIISPHEDLSHKSCAEHSQVR